MSGECDRCGEHCLDCRCNGWTFNGSLDGFNVKPSQPISIIGDGFYETVADGNNIIVRPKWISVKDNAAPKEGKFLFHYRCGLGLGEYGSRFEDINNNSEYAGDCYHLVLSPQEVNPNSRYCDVMEWDDDKMIEMNVFWIPLPHPPQE